jgi:hypothetical protein
MEKSERYKRIETIIGERLESIEQWLIDAQAAFEAFKDSDIENKGSVEIMAPIVERVSDIEVGARDILKVIEPEKQEDIEKALEEVESEIGIKS